MHRRQKLNKIFIFLVYKCFFKRIVCTLLFFLLFFCVFYYIAFYCNSDIPTHARMAVVDMRKGILFEGNFLLYRLMNVCSGLSYEVRQTLIACCFLLAVSKVFLFWIVLSSLKEQFGAILSFAISVSLLFVSVVPFDLFMGHYHFYLGYLVPNVWHNSTIIFSMPFSVLIYLYSLRILNTAQIAQWDQMMLLGLLVLINVFIKPSFFFIYGCSYCLVVFYNFMPDIRKMLKLSFPVIIGLGALLYQYLTIFSSQSGNSVAFVSCYGLKFWIVFGIYFFISMMLPFVFFIVNHKKIIMNYEFQLVCLMLFFSIFIWLVFKETGTRADHGNFYWQVIPAMWIVYFYIIKIECGLIKNNCAMIKSKGHMLILGYYALAFVFGLFYLSYYLYSGLYG